LFLIKISKYGSLFHSKNWKLIQEALKKYSQEFYKKNLKLTKNQIRESISEDQIIIQTSANITEINKVVNILSKRLREWYGFILPELEHKIEDNRRFAELVLQPKKDLEKRFNIKESMGIDLSERHTKEIKELAKTILQLFKEKDSKEKYLEQIMKTNCPNLSAVAGFLIGAKLIAMAGSLRNMVVMPASTIQLLGAEKALFRHMITGAKSPRHGIIVNHPLISGKPQSEHGKRARALADKISLAVKIDYFKGEFIGEKLVKELEERFR